MKKCIITVKDEVWANISGVLPNEIEYLWNKFGVFVEGYFFAPKYKLGQWDGKIRFFEKTGKTYLRLLEEIIPYLEGWNYDIELRDLRPAVSPVEPTMQIDWFAGHQWPNGKNIQLRDYQVAAINDAIINTGGIILAATGAGKTLMTAAISDILGKQELRVMTVVPSADLVTQTVTTYRACGLDVGVYSGSEKDYHHQHVVSTWQALQNNPGILEMFQAFIWDESQGAKADVAKKILNDHAKHIAWRFGVTGTLPKPESDQMAIHATIGKVVHEISAKWLQDNGYLAKVEIEPVEIGDKAVLKEANKKFGGGDDEFPDYSAETAYLAKNEARMDFIADLIIAKQRQFGNTLVLVNSIKFGEKLAKKINDSVFLYGATDGDIRKEWYDLFETRDDLIVVASSGIASTGISIDRVFCLMVVDAKKSFVRTIQSIGRGLRKSHDKDFVHVADVYSNLKFSKKHAKERAKWYAEVQYPVLKTQKVVLK
jgi:superfamily II DNA or RNA helicase